ncbi:alpha/beta hydrolase [Bifidobacterium sp. 82T24]|uniref:Alpha/beta hydrolase fold domain-containing protein n=2 Tax=Bifidobacterium TaxID=1678 RepID=A0ABX0C791_9BIFI|nr:MULTISPECIES: alpha/beta hydrolase [Bifidobacterium]MBW3088739.1 alpha/beta hydrolase [Bifidobacterium pluvialisilvae]NEG96360.1 alpha/beta hydrolase fold domain-containing protein [Bifidobacterium sp. SMB2]NEH11008.1 alpha/beta hydrolase fold domain-containing protein [Bifidobacterium saimiriisciurei]
MMSNRYATAEGVPYTDWTEIDGDLGDCPEPLRSAILKSRVDFADGDASRVPFWHTPDDVDVIADLPYADDADEVRGHRLDLYLPHEAVVRGGQTMPVYVDIHGGGFVYGHKELNRNFCTHLASRGFAVFSVNYRPSPQTDFLGQLRDVAQALAWIRDHRAEYPIAQDGVWLTGDSAGGCLAFFTAAVERSASVAAALGVEASGIGVNGAALVSGLYNLLPYVPAAGGAAATAAGEDDPKTILDAMSSTFFAPLADVDRSAVDVAEIVRSVDLPPLFLNTSSDDFIQSETLHLAALLSEGDTDFELHDWKTAPAETLGHVFPVCMSWLEESGVVLDLIRDFTYSRL